MITFRKLSWVSKLLLVTSKTPFTTFVKYINKLNSTGFIHVQTYYFKLQGARLTFDTLSSKLAFKRDLTFYLARFTNSMLFQYPFFNSQDLALPLLEVKQSKKTEISNF